MLLNIYQISFRVVTLGTQHKFSDEPIKHILQLVRLVGSVDDVTVIFGIKLGLSAEFTTKKLGRVCGDVIQKKNYTQCNKKLSTDPMICFDCKTCLF